MTPAAYAEEQRKLLEIAAAVQALELDALLEELTKTELRAPLLPSPDWETWESGGAEEVAAVKNLARELVRFRDEVLRQIEQRGRSAA